jgi:hypothetical protein
MRERVEQPAARVPALRGRALPDRGTAPGEVVTLLRRRLDRLAEQRAEIRTLLDNTPARGGHGLFLVEEDYRLDLLEAESTFVRRFIDQITHPETGWGRPWAAFHGEPFTTEERQQS